VNRALYAAASGMAAQQKTLDLVSDNLANADVAGFKGAVASFAAIGGDSQLGTAPTGTHQIFTQGKLMKSGGPFDVAIDGTGFFRIERSGVHAFTRAGSFSRGADGLLRNAEGWHLEGVRVPAGATSLSVGLDGGVRASVAGGHEMSGGRIALATFDAPERLHVIDSAVFGATPEAGRPQRLPAGHDRQPKIVFGMLEKSNVSIIESMMSILSAQRAYEANSKGVQAADEMLRIANNLHRS